MRKTPDEIIVHKGTNYFKDDTKSAEVVAAGILNLGNQIKDNSPNTKVSISSLIVRNDKTSVLNKINGINIILKRVCNQNNWTYIDHNNIDYSCLNRRDLHLNRKGSSLVCRNFSQYLNIWNMTRPGENINVSLNVEFPNNKGFKMGMLNIVSLPKYIDEIRIILADQYFDVLALNETRLDKNISNQDMFIQNYDLIRAAALGREEAFVYM